jgi:hypothetical protein
MRNKKSSKNTVELYIDGPEITADKFSRCVKAFFGLIQDVATDVSGKRSGVKWVVSVKPGSIGLCATAMPTDGNLQAVHKTIGAIRSGLCTINKGKPKPKHFSSMALENLHELGTAIDLGGQGIHSIRVGVEGSWNDISSASISHVEKLLRTPTKSFGSVEGRLVALELSGRLHFGIDEVLTGKRIHCYFGEDIYNDVIKALKQRVSAYGLIRYQKNGEPKDIEIEKIKVFQEDSKLPKFKDIIGLYAGQR